MRALRYFYLVYFCGVVVITLLNMIRLNSKRNSLYTSYAHDFFAAFIWPCLVISQKGRSFLKQLIKGS